MRRFILSFAFLGLAAAASAQPAGPGWSAFAGCWTPVSASGERNVAANTPRLCVLPNANGTSAELLTVASELSTTQRTTMDASGQRADVSKQGCSGWEKAEFSSDGRRLYLSGEQTCAGGLKRKTSGVFAIASNGDWINAVDVSADSVSSVRVSRYQSSGIFPTMPTEVRDALTSREASDRTARISAQRPVSVDAVIEGSRFLSAPAEQAWLAELEQDFNLDAKALTRLADANVSPAVIDVLVAVSNPKLFSVHGAGSIDRNDDSVRVRRDPNTPCFAPVIDPWAWNAYDPCDPYMRYSYYRPRYSRYGYPYGYGYGYGYGSGYYDGYYGNYGNPVIIVQNGGSSNHGRMTKDGYRPGSSSGSATTSSSSGREASPKSSSGSSSSGSSGSSGSSSSGGSSSGSSGNGGRTATKKPPVDDAPREIQRAPHNMTTGESTTSRQSTPSSTTSTSSDPATPTSTSTSTSSGDGGRVATRKPPA